MRALFSLVALVLVVFVVMKLGGNQLDALKRVAPAASGANPSQRAADQIQRALEQGAAQRASDAAGR